MERTAKERIVAMMVENCILEIGFRDCRRTLRYRRWIGDVREWNRPAIKESKKRLKLALKEVDWNGMRRASMASGHMLL